MTDRKVEGDKFTEGQRDRQEVSHAEKGKSNIDEKQK